MPIKRSILALVYSFVSWPWHNKTLDDYNIQKESTLHLVVVPLQS